MRRILEPGNLILLFPIRDAAPMSAAGFADEQIVMLPDFARSARHRGSWNAWTTTLRGPRSTRDRSRRDAL